MNPLQMIQQVKSNPMQFLTQHGVNVPQNIANNPEAITQHLLNSGTITQEQYNNAVKQANQLGFRK